MNVYSIEESQCMLCTDDSIIIGPDKEEIKQVLEDLKKIELDVTVEGTL